MTTKSIRTLTFTTRSMLVCALGPENPLPPLPPLAPSAPPPIDPSLPDEDRRYLGWGDLPGVMPYRMQDDYTRDPRPTGLATAVLENDHLRAEFLLEWGGRLWSLIDKRTRRELLHTHPVLQPANLARRNAWFSGGVEWNFGVPGHTVSTCSPVFAARARGADGQPVLRLYEWDRMRRMPFQIDFWLDEGRPVLLARVRLVNPHPVETPVYWWSNIAVAESPEVRVLAPADSAVNTQYGVGLRLAGVPQHEGRDVSYPTNGPIAADYFFRVPAGRRPWVCALDGAGRGLVQTSTSRQRGRKLFIWGMGAGGRRWQEYLNGPGNGYIEIQAGLARTQYECMPMPAQADWEWIEAYGLLEADPARVHGVDWDGARGEVASRLEALVAEAWLEAELVRGAEAARRAPEEILHRGSGWGALNDLGRAAAGQSPGHDAALVFDEPSLGPDQAPWLALVHEGALPEGDPAQPPGGWMIEPAWRTRLEASMAGGGSDPWTAWLHLGVMRYCAGEPEAAREAWTRSFERQPAAWAARNLAFLARQQQHLDEALAWYRRAMELAPAMAALAVETCDALFAAGRPGEILEFLGRLTPEVQASPRLRLAHARAALDAGDLETVECLLGAADFVIADIREGEVSLSNLWQELWERRLATREGRDIDDEIRRRAREEHPVPAHLDFRMSGGAT